MVSGRVGRSGAWLLALVLVGCGCGTGEAPGGGEPPPVSQAPAAPDSGSPEATVPDAGPADAGRPDGGAGQLTGATLWLHHPTEPKHELSGGVAVGADSGALYSAATHGAERDYSSEGDAELRLVVTRLEPGGAVVWTRSFPVTRPPPMGEIQDSGSVRARIAADPAGNVYLAGEVRGTMELGGGAQQRGTFLAKLSPAGALRWSKALPAGYEPGPVATDTAGNVFVGVLANGPPQPDGSCVPMDGRVVKYSPEGAPLWDVSIGAPQCDGNRAEVRALDVDGAGRVALGGAFSGVLRFGERRFATERFSPYLAVLAPDGSLAWLAAFSSASGAVSGVGVTPRGTVVATGFQSSKGTLTWGETRLESTGESTPLFLLVAEPSGLPRWAKDLGAGERPALGVDSASVTVAGLTRTFRDPARPGVDPAQNPQLFASRYQLDGARLWTRIFLRTEGRPDLFAEEMVGVAPVGDGSYVLAGQFTGPTDFGTGVRTNQNTDVFVLRLAP